MPKEIEVPWRASLFTNLPSPGIKSAAIPHSPMFYIGKWHRNNSDGLGAPRGCS